MGDACCLRMFLPHLAERRAHGAIAEVHHFGTKGYHWVLDADIEACFDNIAHSALMERMRRRVGDKRVLSLVKAFLKAGIMSVDGQTRDTNTGPGWAGSTRRACSVNAADTIGQDTL
ncbi:reverse transcriptase domain-containing protein [Nonomuraea sp. NBC_00507]|uniref:hypothetical protein n=1 Tax=Nonomuraea sp. NBC_00507 TaxID=2976002 RepID=UPI002E19EEA8